MIIAKEQSHSNAGEDRALLKIINISNKFEIIKQYLTLIYAIVFYIYFQNLYPLRYLVSITQNICQCHPNTKINYLIIVNSTSLP